MEHEITLVFVYGTLMSGQRAHHFLSGGTLLGTWLLRGYAMYQVKNYPGIVEEPGKHVIGEVYAIPKNLLIRMDEYEEEGTLYHRRTVTVTRGMEQMEVQAYIYAKAVDPDTFMPEPWGSSDDDLVWYAGHGFRSESAGLCKITRAQLKHINGPNQYPNLHCLDIAEDGAPIYTATSSEI